MLKQSVANNFTDTAQCQPEVVDLSDYNSCCRNSDSETVADVSDVPTNLQASQHSDQLQSYQEFKMQHPKKTKTNRSRKIRALNKNKPSTGKKQSAQKTNTLTLTLEARNSGAWRRNQNHT